MTNSDKSNQGEGKSEPSADSEENKPSRGKREVKPNKGFNSPKKGERSFKRDSDRPRRDNDRPRRDNDRGGPRRDTDRSRGPRRDNDRGGPRRDNDRPRRDNDRGGFGRDTDRSRGPRRDNDRGGPRRDNDRSRGPRRDNDRGGPRRDNDRPRRDNDRGGFGRDTDRSRGPRRDNDRGGPRRDNDRPRGPRRDNDRPRRDNDRGGPRRDTDRPRRSNESATASFETLTLTPSHWGAKGESLLEEDGQRTIIWRGIPGEEVTVRVMNDGKNQRFVDVLSVKNEPGFGRRTPKCPKMDACGGCPMMHLSLEAQHQAKLKMLEAHFEAEEIVGLCPTEIVGSESNQWNYRHSVKMVVDNTQEGNIRLGVRGRRGHVVPIPDCEVSTPLLRNVMKSVAYHVTGRSEILSRDVWAYGTDDKHPDSGLRYVVLRQTSTDNPQVQICFVVGRYSSLYRELADSVMRQYHEVVSVSVHINRSQGNAIFLSEISKPETYTSVHGEEREESFPNGSFATLTGLEHIEDEIGVFRYRIGAGDFFQANSDIALCLQQAVVEESKEFPGQAMVDLYCGVGLFTIPLAKEHGWAMGIEAGTGAVERAKDNARINKVSAEFLTGDVCASLELIKKRLGGRPPVVVVDPARRGLEPGVIDALVTLNPLKLIYVSCGPKSLAHDLKYFIGLGWTVRSVQAFDMFPQTAHVETIAVLIPPNSAPISKRGPRRRILGR